MKIVEKKEPSTPSVVKVKWIDGMRFAATDSIITYCDVCNRLGVC